MLVEDGVERLEEGEPLYIEHRMSDVRLVDAPPHFESKAET